MSHARRKLIVDTDPGIDDAFALAIAAQTMREEIEIVGVTTMFGNVRRDEATRNAKLMTQLTSISGDERGFKVPVVDGSRVPIGMLAHGDREGRGAHDADDSQVFVADFVHADDGFGGARARVETEAFEKEKAYAYEAGKEAADFIAETCARYPGEVTVLALASLTNVALAFRRYPECLRTMGELVVLGGAFSVNGNVNPAAEANILGDPDAADEVFRTFERTYVVGLDVTTRVQLHSSDLARLARPFHSDGNGDSNDGKKCSDRVRLFLHDAAQFYKQYHLKAAGLDGIYMHDPTALLLAVPSIRNRVFTLHEGAVRVVTEGISRGQTILDVRRKWHVPNEWTSAPKCRVALDIDVDAALVELRSRLGCAPEGER
jgi:uridine nucleosidase